MWFPRNIFTLCVLLNPEIFVDGEIAILGRGIGYIENDDIALLFYVTVKNVCKDDLDLSLNMVRCCEDLGEDGSDCESMTLIGGYMGTLYPEKVKNYTLVYPNLYLTNRSGICTVAISYRSEFKRRKVLTEIPFDTTKQDSNLKSCATVDEDPQQNCNPVDCLAKYSGGLSYFDPFRRRCRNIPTCISSTRDVAYSPFSNECFDPNVTATKQNLESLQRSGDNCPKVSLLNSICHYGGEMPDGECNCEGQWTSFMSPGGLYIPGVAQLHLCNIELGDWTYVNKTRVRLTTILIAVFAITVVTKILLLLCILNWCYRYFKKEKICTDEVDPNDQSLLLCEDQILDKCLCEKERTSSKLQSQTVNVNYYPGSSNIFANIKASNSSSDRTADTEQSIEFTGSSSASHRVSLPEEVSSSSENRGVGREEKVEYYYEEETEESDSTTRRKRAILIQMDNQPNPEVS